MKKTTAQETSVLVSQLIARIHASKPEREAAKALDKRNADRVKYPKLDKMRDTLLEDGTFEIQQGE
jgi:hypothetical protein